MRKPSSRPWYFHELFILAARFSLTLGAVFSSHVLCEANHFADGLAKQASHGCDLKYPGTVSYGTFYVSCLLLYSFSFLFWKELETSIRVCVREMMSAGHSLGKFVGLGSFISSVYLFFMVDVLISNNYYVERHCHFPFGLCPPYIPIH
jgi:hypothetical protein